MPICTVCNKPWTLAYCGRHGGDRLTATQDLPADPQRAAPSILNRVYRVLQAELPLASRHREALLRRGLTETEIARRGYRTLPLQGRSALARCLVMRFGDPVCRQIPGLVMAGRDGRQWWSLAGAAGLLVPVRDCEERIVAWKVRADDLGNGPKYTTLSSAKHGGPGASAHAHMPIHERMPQTAIRVTEGELKADVATVLSGLLTVSIPGVAMWRCALPVLQAIQPRQVRLAFDADWRTNPHVALALSQCASAMMAAGYEVLVEVWEPSQGKGIDDILVAGHAPALHSASLALGIAVRSRARQWTGGLSTVDAQEMAKWRV